MADTMTVPLTLGMQLDAALAQLDALSSPQLYSLIVLGTVLVSTFVLGAPKPLLQKSVYPELPLPVLPNSSNNSSNNNNNSSAAKTTTATGPEPRWYIFRLFNYAVLLAFTGSVVEFVWHADDYASDHTLLLRVLLAWCLGLVYFFGFFGVSIVHSDILAVPDSSAAAATSRHAVAQKEGDINKKGKMMDTVPVKDLGCGIPTTQSRNPTRKPTTTKAASTSPSPPSSDDYTSWTDAQLAQLVMDKQWKDHELEKRLDAHRAVQVRRCVVQQKLAEISGDATNSSNSTWQANLPAEPSLDYGKVYGANCEIVIGYVPLPVGLVGPLHVNGQPFYVPMATTEGCLVASTNRGAKAIQAGGGATAVVTRDGITRAPCLRLGSAKAAAHLKIWCETPINFVKLQAAFESTTRYGKLSSCQVTVAGKNAYVRLVCQSGDAMGMNMVSKGSLAVIDCLREQYSADISLVALSGNMCTDKKSAAVNWLQGRGKSVVVEAIIPADVVRSVLKTTVPAMVSTNLHKNLIGSAMAGSLGGFNAHAANIVTAVFLATGQDPAQNVESSQCITLLEETEEGDLWISCTMPCLEVGTVGGGTSLAAQAACLDLIGCRGGCAAEPGANARQLAMVVASATLAGELSLLAALAANTLVQAHMQHNRKK